VRAPHGRPLALQQPVWGPLRRGWRLRGRPGAWAATHRTRSHVRPPAAVRVPLCQLVGHASSCATPLTFCFCRPLAADVPSCLLEACHAIAKPVTAHLSPNRQHVRAGHAKCAPQGGEARQVISARNRNIPQCQPAVLAHRAQPVHSVRAPAQPRAGRKVRRRTAGRVRRICIIGALLACPARTACTCAEPPLEHDMRSMCSQRLLTPPAGKHRIVRQEPKTWRAKVPVARRCLGKQ